MVKPEQGSLRFLRGIALSTCARLRANLIKGLQDVFPDREDAENDPQSLNESTKQQNIMRLSPTYMAYTLRRQLTMGNCPHST